MPKKSISLILIIAFLTQAILSPAYGQSLPITYNLTPRTFDLPILRYLSVNTANPSNYFNFLMDRGQRTEDGSQSTELNQEAKKLISYFFLGLTLPSESFWVNLKPQEPERITSEELSKTDLGRTLLEQDLKLKKDMANYLHPKHPQGKLYWERLYAAIGKDKAKKVTITSSSRVWIVPAEAVVLETEDGALVAKATLKVLLESEYLSLSRKTKKLKNLKTEELKNEEEQIRIVSENLMKEIILPALTKEINESPGYAPLRQVYHSLILAEWYKRKHRDASLRGATATKQSQDTNNPYSRYINSGTTTGLESELPWSKQAIWQEYLKSYQEGEYKLQDTIFGLKRMYFSGGVEFTGINPVSSPLALNSLTIEGKENIRGVFGGSLPGTVAGSPLNTEKITVYAPGKIDASFEKSIAAASPLTMREAIEILKIPSTGKYYETLSFIEKNHLRATEQDLFSAIDAMMDFILEAPDGSALTALRFLKTIEDRDPRLSQHIGPFLKDVIDIFKARDILVSFRKLPKEIRSLATNANMVKYLANVISGDSRKRYNAIESIGYSKNIFSALFLLAMEKDSQTKIESYNIVDMAFERSERSGDLRAVFLTLFSNPSNFFTPLLIPTKDSLRWRRENIENNVISKEEFKALLNKLSPEGLMRVKEFMFAKPGYFTFEELGIFFPEQEIHKFMASENGIKLEFYGDQIMPRNEARKRLTEIMKSVYKPNSEAIMPEDAMLLPSHRAILAIDKNGEVIGFIHYTSSGFINEVAILPGNQGSGIGARMLEAATYDLARVGNKEASLNIASFEDLLNEEIIYTEFSDGRKIPTVRQPYDFYSSFIRNHEGYELTYGSTGEGLWEGSPSRLIFPKKMVEIAATSIKSAGSPAVQSASPERGAEATSRRASSTVEGVDKDTVKGYFDNSKTLPILQIKRSEKIANSNNLKEMLESLEVLREVKRSTKNLKETLQDELQEAKNDTDRKDIIAGLGIAYPLIEGIKEEDIENYIDFILKKIEILTDRINEKMSGLHPNDINAGLTPDSTIGERTERVNGWKDKKDGVSPVASGYGSLPVASKNIHPIVFDAVVALNKIRGIKTVGSGPDEINSEITKEGDISEIKSILESAIIGLPMKISYREKYGYVYMVDLILEEDTRLKEAKSHWDEFANRLNAGLATLTTTTSQVVPVKNGQEGGIDFSQIELTLKDDKYISSLNPADIKILRAAKALKEEWNSLSLLYIHELILLLKDNLASDIQNKNLLSQVLRQLQSQKFLDPQAIQFLKLIQSQKPISEIKLALYR